MAGNVTKTGAVLIIAIGAAVAAVGLLAMFADVLSFGPAGLITGIGIGFAVLGVRALGGKVSW